jgi:hypothetical protein
MRLRSLYISALKRGFGLGPETLALRFSGGLRPMDGLSKCFHLSRRGGRNFQQRIRRSGSCGRLRIWGSGVRISPSAPCLQDFLSAPKFLALFWLSKLAVSSYVRSGGQRLFETAQLPPIRLRAILFFRDFDVIPEEVGSAVEGVKPVVLGMRLARFAVSIREPMPAVGAVFNGFWDARHGVLVGQSALFIWRFNGLRQPEFPLGRVGG